MAMLTVRNLDPAVKERLRVRAAQNGHSMEAEARRILQAALSEVARAPEGKLLERVHRRFAALGGADLKLPARGPAREPPRFE